MHLCNRLDDGQPQPVVGAAVMAGGVYPVETLEQMRQMLCGNRLARVADADRDLPGLLLDQHLDRFTGLGVLHGIAQQVDQCPAQVGFFNIGQGITADPHFNPRILKYKFQILQGRRYFVRQ